jgi:protoporphyrinogen oxidase
MDRTPEHKTAVIIGAGPAGLTAAFEFVTRSRIRPVLLEKSTYMGGISRTVNYKGNRIDIGGHRFFSKSDRVMNWWLDRLPMQAINGSNAITYHGMTRLIEKRGPNAAAADPDHQDRVMLLRPRQSRIYYLRRFFDYPISLSARTVQNLGLWRMIRIAFSYMRIAMFPLRKEENLEEFFINRFGRELYATFFRSYTEKVWGVPCTKISAAWGAQRIKGLSIWKTLAHAASAIQRKLFGGDQQKVETSLIEQFLYPKFGPGQMWETVADQVLQQGATILTRHTVTRIHHDGKRIRAIEARNEETGAAETFEGDYFFSTMPIRELIRALSPAADPAVMEVSDGLVYRDFITVGLLLRTLKIRERDGAPIKDNWIYIQEPDVLVGRVQIFNNWSPYMVGQAANVWIGLEYFCNDNDALWKMADNELIALAKEEMARIGMIEAGEVLDATVLRMEKTYPAYFGSYDRFDEIRKYVDGFENLFLVGRNGMHRYNNQDHSMLTAMISVDNILAGRTDKSNIWEVNTEEDYHEAESDSAKAAKA